MTVPAHDQQETHHYITHYPDHFPRESDPHYKDFKAYHDKYKDVAKCDFAVERGGDFSECILDKPLELHHAHIEFAVQNGIDLALLEHVYPGVSNPNEVGAWVESGANFEWLCQFHHRGTGGKHCASVSDYEAEHFVRKFIQGA